MAMQAKTLTHSTATRLMTELGLPRERDKLYHKNCTSISYISIHWVFKYNFTFKSRQVYFNQYTKTLPH